MSKPTAFRLGSRNRIIVCISALTAVLQFGGCAGIQTNSGAGEGHRSQVVGDFSLHDLKGRRVRLSDFSGKAVLLSFWATWCDPCQQELVQMQTLWERYRERGLELLSVNTDPPENESTVRDTVQRYRYRFPVLLDSDSEVVNRFNPKLELPYSVLLDRAGRIAKIHQGYKSGDEVLIDKEIRDLLGG